MLVLNYSQKYTAFTARAHAPASVRSIQEFSPGISVETFYHVNLHPHAEGNIRNVFLPSPSLPSSFFCSSTDRGVSPSSPVWIQLSETVCNLLPFLSSLPFFFSLIFSFVVFLQETHWRSRHLNITSGLNSACCHLTHGTTQGKNDVINPISSRQILSLKLHH